MTARKVFDFQRACIRCYQNLSKSGRKTARGYIWGCIFIVAVSMYQLCFTMQSKIDWHKSILDITLAISDAAFWPTVAIVVIIISLLTGPIKTINKELKRVTFFRKEK